MAGEAVVLWLKRVVELVRPVGADEFIASYLKLFEPEIEYTRYFPKQEYYDTIKLPFDAKPVDSDEFLALLKQATEAAVERLKQ